MALWFWLCDYTMWNKWLVHFIFISTGSIISDEYSQRSAVVMLLYSHSKIALFFLMLYSLFGCCCVQIFDSKRKAYTSTCLLLHTTVGGKTGWWARHTAGVMPPMCVLFLGVNRSTFFRPFLDILCFSCFSSFVFLLLGGWGWAAPCVWFSDRTRRKKSLSLSLCILFFNLGSSVFALSVVCVVVVVSSFSHVFPPFLDFSWFLSLE